MLFYTYSKALLDISNLWFYLKKRLVMHVAKLLMLFNINVSEGS